MFFQGLLNLLSTEAICDFTDADLQHLAGDSNESAAEEAIEEVQPSNAKLSGTYIGLFFLLTSKADPDLTAIWWAAGHTH